MYKEISRELISFINDSPTSFHANDTVKKLLNQAGYTELSESHSWELKTGGKYYVSKNTSALIAFTIGTQLDQYSFNISAAHCDTPTFKIKPVSRIVSDNRYHKLNVEMYGGALCAPWFDRPLSVAGRAIIKNNDRFETKLVNIDKDLLIIPNLAIHLDREANNGKKYNTQIDMLPLAGSTALDEKAFETLIAESLSVEPDTIYSSDLYLYPRISGTMIGLEEEFIGSPRLDDLQCVFATLKGFLDGKADESINVFYMADNEEVGSSTKQGAASTFLIDTLSRINQSLGGNDERLHCALASSMIVSADNAHAVHPNHQDLSDPHNRVYMNDGVVIKYSARQSYTTDALSAALFIECCKKADVPYQHYTNRSDLMGGGTLGAISSHQVSIASIDIGLAQLAMHSSFELAGAKDTAYMIEAMKVFFSTHLEATESGVIIAK